jgi:tetratricopeptide (TPR) repeat protein
MPPQTADHLAEAGQLLKRGDLAHAARVLTAMPDLNGNAEALHLLGLVRRGQDRPAQAIALFQRALVLRPDHLACRYWLGLTLQDCERYAEVEALLKDGLGLAGDAGTKAAFAYNLASAQYHQGRKKDALDNYTLAAALDPRFNAEINCADLLEDLHQADEAAALLEQALARDPGNAALHAAYNNLLHRLGRDAEFLASYDRAPRTPALLAGKAGLLLKKNRPAQAHALYSEILESQPLDGNAVIGAATALNDLQRSAEAAALLEEALKRHPQDVALAQTLACALLQSNDPQKAAAIALQALPLAPLDQSTLAALGTAWRMMGDPRDELLNGYDDLIQAFDLEPPEGFSSMDDFHFELNGWLSGLHSEARGPLDQSLRGGSQTRGPLFGQGNPLAHKLKARIAETVTRYLDSLKPDARHPFRGRRREGIRFQGSWSSRLRDCGFHTNHIHPGGWISSCYYVALPDAVQDEREKQGWIKFGEPSFDVGLALRRAIQPKPGRLVLFPSYMWHGTIAFREKALRTTIAFDAIPV